MIIRIKSYQPVRKMTDDAYPAIIGAKSCQHVYEANGSNSANVGTESYHQFENIAKRSVPAIIGTKIVPANRTAAAIVGLKSFQQLG